MTSQKFVREGAYRETSDGHVLIGGKCADCDRHFFPVPDICFNCLGQDVSEVELSAEGKLFSWSTIHMKAAHFDPPYTIGYVDLPEGVRVFGPIQTEGAEPSLTVGQLMQIGIGPLWDEDEAPVHGHFFTPLRNRRTQ